MISQGAHYARPVDLDLSIDIKPIIPKKKGTMLYRERLGANADLWDLVPAAENPRYKIHNQRTAKKQS